MPAFGMDADSSPSSARMRRAQAVDAVGRLANVEVRDTRDESEVTVCRTAESREGMRGVSTARSWGGRVLSFGVRASAIRCVSRTGRCCAGSRRSSFSSRRAQIDAKARESEKSGTSIRN